jgi:hypothetical protein
VRLARRRGRRRRRQVAEARQRPGPRHRTTPNAPQANCCRSLSSLRSPGRGSSGGSPSRRPAPTSPAANGWCASGAGWSEPKTCR